MAHEEGKKLEDEASLCVLSAAETNTDIVSVLLQAMEIASRTVSELIRLKDVAKWKLWAGDSTDDFTNKVVPARVIKAAQQVSSQASEAIQGSSTPLVESVSSSVSEAVSDAASSVSGAILGSSTPITESIASTASVAYESPRKVFGGANAQVLAEAREVVFDEPLVDDEEDVPTYSDKVQNIVADAGDRAAELSRAVSEALLGVTTTQGTVESATSLANEQYQRALAAASSVLYGTQQPAVESATSVASERFAQAVTAASYAIYGTPTPTAIIRTVQMQVSLVDGLKLRNVAKTSRLADVLKFHPNSTADAKAVLYVCERY